MPRQFDTNPFAVTTPQLTASGSPEVSEALRSDVPYTEPVGLLAVIQSPTSQNIPFKSGAEGFTDAQVHIVGEHLDREILGKSLGWVSLSYPTEVGNVLLIPRETLIDTSNELAKRFSEYQTPFNGMHLTAAIMSLLSVRDLDNVRYDACVSYFVNPVTGNKEVACATPGASNPAFLRLPLPNSTSNMTA